MPSRRALFLREFPAGLSTEHQSRFPLLAPPQNVYFYVSVRVCLCGPVCLYVSVHVPVCAYVFACVFTCLPACVYVCICVCLRPVVSTHERDYPRIMPNSLCIMLGGLGSSPSQSAKPIQDKSPSDGTQRQSLDNPRSYVMHKSQAHLSAQL